MADQFVCNSCGASYVDVDRHGIPYAHVCGPATIVEAALDSGAIEARPLPQWLGITLAPDRAAKDALIAGGADPRTIAIERSRRRERRADRRDENPTGRERGRLDPVEIVAEGAGRTRLGPAPAVVET